MVYLDHFLSACQNNFYAIILKLKIVSIWDKFKTTFACKKAIST